MKVQIIPAVYTFRGDPRAYHCFEVYIDGEHFDSYQTLAKAEHAQQFIRSQIATGRN